VHRIEPDICGVFGEKWNRAMMAELRALDFSGDWVGNCESWGG
jgi:hypothetical protein